MTSGIEFFLSQCVQDQSKHPKGWDWYVLDSERLQQDILHVLFNNSEEFCRSLFGERGECFRAPNAGLFDLLVHLKTGAEIYVEIKSDHDWSDQKLRQLKFLLTRPAAKCAIVLFSQRAATITRTDVEAQDPDKFFKISYRQLHIALDAMKNANKAIPGLLDFSTAYGVALKMQEQRTRLRWGNPDL